MGRLEEMEDDGEIMKKWVSNLLYKLFVVSHVRPFHEKSQHIHYRFRNSWHLFLAA